MGSVKLSGVMTKYYVEKKNIASRQLDRIVKIYLIIQVSLSQLTAFFTSAAIFISSVAVNSFSAK